MSKTTEILGASKACVVYQNKDYRGRQVLVARRASGEELFRCRHVKSMARFLDRTGLEFYEYKTLPRRTRIVLDSKRSAERAEVRKSQVGWRWTWPKLADVWPT